MLSDCTCAPSISVTPPTSNTSSGTSFTCAEKLESQQRGVLFILEMGLHFQFILLYSLIADMAISPAIYSQSLPS